MHDPSDPVIRLRRVSKVYGRRHALSGITLTVNRGEILGLAGPNGAGKSTLLGIIAGFVRPSSGSGTVLGLRIAPDSRPAPFVGLMLEKPAFIEHRSARSNLRMLAAIRGAIGPVEVDRALRDAGLDPSDRKPVRTYSQGMRQRLSLAQALMERPPLLLLDEPTNGLDPIGVLELRRAIRKAAASGATVIIASHLLSEMAATCDRILIIDDGRVARDLLVEPAGEQLEGAYLASVRAR